MAVKIDDLAEAIAKELEVYTDDVTEAVKKSVDEIAKETNEVIKDHCTFGGSGVYKKSFTVRTLFETPRTKTKAWCVKAPHYRLTHLLENGHANRDGGRTKAYPHIKYGEEYSQEELPKRIKEKINDIS